jgi:hypothetical protein
LNWRRFNRIHDDEIAELEAALRDLWVIEEKKYED